MIKIYTRCSLLFWVALFTLVAPKLNAQVTVTSPAVSSFTYFSATAAGAIVFGMKNTNTSDITITEVGNYLQAGFTGTFTLWYHPTAVTGAPTAITTANGWVSLATNSVTSTTAGIYTSFTNVNLVLPVNTTYRFAISGPANSPYYGGTATTPNVYTGGGLEIYVQDNANSPGYGGAFPGPPASTPRSFLGSITFVPTSACSGTPSAGQATASTTLACTGGAVVLDLTANTIGTGQTYQWQTASAQAGPYTNIGTVSASPMLGINPTASAWYRAIVSCNGGTPVESQPVQVRVTPAFAGTYTIDQTLPTAGTNFQSFTDAINALNACGAPTAPVTFNVIAGQVFSEDVPVLTATGSSTNTITFQKSGSGSNPKIMPVSSGTISTTSLGNHGDGIVIINGGDYITFDAIDLEASSGFSGAGFYEYGYYLKKATATNACKNITIKNCAITLNKAQLYSYGVHVSNISGTASITVTSTGGRSENIKIWGNTISNSYGGVQVSGFNAPSPYDLFDQNIEIGVAGGNTISNFGGGTAIAYGIYTIYANNTKIANNVISGGAGSTAAVYGIQSTTAIQANVDIYGNQISLESAGTTDIVYGISNGAGGTGTSNTININNNTINNINLTTSTSGSIYAIYQLASALNVNIYDNVVNNLVKSGTGTIYSIYNSSSAASGNVKIYKNRVSNISGASTIYGIYSNPVATTNTSIYNDTVSNLTSATVYGITTTSGAGVNIYQNKIFDLVSTGSASYGIHATSGTAGNTYNLHNNLIGNLTAPTANVADAVRGINLAATTGTTTWNVSYNTIYLNATSSGTNFGSAGIYHTGSATATTGTLVLRNNIIHNTSTSNGTGRTSAFRRSTTSLANYAAASNNNNFYVDTLASPNHLLFYDGTTAIRNMSAYKAHVSPRDNLSISELTPFLNTTTGSAADFLHLDPAIPTQVESGGAVIPGIDTDYDGHIRQGSTGYTGSGTAPDIGADEFQGTPADFTAPSITHAPLKFTCSVGDRTFTATISDAVGVATSAGLRPRVYYRKGSGTWYSQPGTLTSGDANNGTWTFTIIAADMGGLIIGNQVEYYIVAQDNANNVASSPAGVVATNVNTITSVPPTTNTYKVSYTLNGTYTINSSSATDGTNFQSFTDAVSVCVSGPVVFNVQPGTYNEQVLIDPIAGASATNTITFNGGGQSLTWLSTNTNERAVVKFNGADYIKFDNLNIIASGSQNTEFGYGVQMVDDADNNTISNCIIGITTTSQTASSTSFAGIVVNSSTSTTPILNGNSQCDNNTFSANTITGGYYGIVLSADGGNNLLVNGNQIRNNIIQDFYSYGIYLNGTNNTLVEGNDVSRASRSSIGVFNGIYATEKSTNLKISKNKVHNSHTANQTETTAAYGIYLTGSDATAGNENIVSNNMIYQFDNSGLQYALYNAGSDYAKYYYNSVLLDKSTANASLTLVTSAFYQTTAATGIEVKNNAFSITRNTPGIVRVLAFNTATTSFASDYNILHLGTSTGATNSVAFLSSDYPTLVGWQGTGSDVHSYNVNPMFTASNDLHLLPGSPADDKGIVIAGITTDIDGDSRGATRTDVGADEMPLASGPDVQATALVSPSVSANNCYGIETITVAIKNNSLNPIDFSVTPVTVNVTVSGAGSGSYGTTISTGTLASGAEMNVTMATPSSTLNMSTAGTYTFDATASISNDVNPANNAMQQVNLTKDALSAGTVMVTPDSYCVTPGAPVLSATGISGYSSLQWQQSTTSTTGFTNIPGATTNPYTLPTAISQNMYYRLVATCGASTEMSAEDTVSITNPQVISTTPGVRCGPGEVTLSGVGSIGAVLNWYSVATGGTPLAIATNSFVTASINTTTTYYVSASDGGLNITAGRVTPFATSTGFAGDNYGLVFDVTQTFKLKTVDVYPTGAAGTLTVELLSSAGTVLQTSGPLSIPAGTGTTFGGGATPFTLNLNFTIQPGTAYRLRTTSHTAAIVRDNPITAVFSYPLPIGNVGTMTSGLLAGAANPNTYYYFFNWQVSTGCESPRTAVTATVKNSPDGTTTLAGTNNGVQVCATYDVAATNYYFANCNLVARVAPQGSSPVAGDITSCVRVDASVQTYGSQPYVQRHYDITPANNAVAATARITLYATQQEFDAYNNFVTANSLSYPLLPATSTDANAVNVRITQFHGTGSAPGNYTGAAQLITPVSVVWNNTNGWWEITADITGFSGFYIHTTLGNGPLPVTMLTFSGVKKENRNELGWVTSSENNSKGFEVERSLDGRHFMSIGFVPTKAIGGNSNTSLNYAFMDPNLAGDKQFYRLKQMDLNNRHSYSKVILLKGGSGSGLALTGLYPNPVSQSTINAMLVTPQSGVLTFIISDALGRTVAKERKTVATGSNTITLQVSRLASGTYFVRLQNSEEKPLSLVKQ